MMQPDIINVLIVEDEIQLAQLHAELVDKHPRLKLIGTAATLAGAEQQIRSKQPNLVLLDNYLPDGKGITLIGHPLLKKNTCSVIFITAASDMETCSQAIRNGAFDYLLKPVSWKRLSNSLERFVQFYDQQQAWKIVDQKGVDSLYQLQGKSQRLDSRAKGIDDTTLQRVQKLFLAQPKKNYSVEEVMEESGLSKTTTRRYLEHGVESGFLQVELLYGKIGHPRRLYRKADDAGSEPQHAH